MNQTVRLTTLAVAAATLILSGCFSSNPARQSEGNSQGQGSSSSGSSQPSPPTSSSPSSQSGSQGQSSTQGSTAPNSTASAPQSSNTPTRETRQGSSSTSQQPGGRTAGDPGGDDGSADIRVATAERAGAGTNAPEAPESDVGGTEGSVSEEPEVGVAEALEGANAAVDAATEAVAEAETAIERAREVANETAGAGDVDSFDPWARPGGGAASADSAAAGGGGQPARSASDSSDTARSENASDATAGPQDRPATAGGGSDGEDNFDPFADYGEAGGGAPDRPAGLPASGSLEIADDAVAAARAALERARRALITAADAGRPGSGDADAEAVQLAAARAAMEAAAEAVIASAIAVMAASESYAPEDYDENPASDEDLLAENVARVVAIVQRDMRNAADALDATGELLAAAGELMAVLGQAEATRVADEAGGAAEDPGDRVASLEEQLDRSLAVFDDRMNAEGSTIVRGMGGEDSEITAAAEAAAGSENTATTGQTGVPRDQRGVMDGAVDRPDVDWNEPRNAARARDPEIPADYEQDYDIEDSVAPQDDDIIARQLREAALAEQDPELREALWQEYVAYKESLEAGAN